MRYSDVDTLQASDSCSNESKRLQVSLITRTKSNQLRFQVVHISKHSTNKEKIIQRSCKDHTSYNALSIFFQLSVDKIHYT